MPNVSLMMTAILTVEKTDVEICVLPASEILASRWGDLGREEKKVRGWNGEIKLSDLGHISKTFVDNSLSLQPSVCIHLVSFSVCGR